MCAVASTLAADALGFQRIAGLVASTAMDVVRCDVNAGATADAVVVATFTGSVIATLKTSTSLPALPTMLVIRQKVRTISRTIGEARSAKALSLCANLSITTSISATAAMRIVVFKRNADSVALALPVATTTHASLTTISPATGSVATPTV